MNAISNWLGIWHTEGSIKAHLSAKFGWNAINWQRIISDYSQKITSICCHSYRINRLWEEAENWCVNRLPIEPQTFCGLKEIGLKTTKIQRKDQQCVTIIQLRLANKKLLLTTPTRKAAWNNALKFAVQME